VLLLSFGSLKSKSSGKETFKARAILNIVLNVGFIIAVSILAIWLSVRPDSLESFSGKTSLCLIVLRCSANARKPFSSNISLRFFAWLSCREVLIHVKNVIALCYIYGFSAIFALNNFFYKLKIVSWKITTAFIYANNAILFRLCVRSELHHQHYYGNGSYKSCVQKGKSVRIMPEMFCLWFCSLISKIKPDSTISNFAGTGSPGYSVMVALQLTQRLVQLMELL